MFTMDHNLLPWHLQLLNLDSYVATSCFLNDFIWYLQKTGHIVIEKHSKKNAILTVVGTVLDNHFDCEGHSNFRNWTFESMQKAKYQLLLGEPTDTPFANDFITAIDNL